MKVFNDSKLLLNIDLCTLQKVLILNIKEIPMYKQFRKKHETKGFTLIELLVVISIIALLLSILMPSLSKAKELAKRTVCAANERQIAMAFMLYSQEYNGMIVPDRGIRPGGVLLKGHQRSKSWDSSLSGMWGTEKNNTYKKYVACPSDKLPRLKDENALFVDYQKEGEVLKRSYGPNMALYNNLWGIRPGHSYWGLQGNSSMIPTKVHRIRRPSKTILVGEIHIGSIPTLPEGDSNRYGNVQGTNHWAVFSRPRLNQMHKDGGNYAFCDGRVEWHALDKNIVNWDSNNPDQQPFKGLNWSKNWQWDN